MRTTTIRIRRPDSTVIATGILAQIDQMSTKAMVEHIALGDYHVGDNWTINTLGWNPVALIHRGDLLEDELYTDEEKTTGAYPFSYRVVSRPKNYFLHHQECMADTAVGN